MRVAEKRGRRPDPAKDAAIVTAARALFLERGYTAPMDDIAAAAGVSKQTLYARYPSKADLFGAIIHQSTENLVEPLHAADRAPPAEALTAFGARYLDLIFDPRRLAMQRLIIAELMQFPQIAHAFFDSGPSNARTALADYLRRQTREGRLMVADPEEGASQLMGLIAGSEHLAALFGLDRQKLEERLKGRVERAVTAFLKLYDPLA